MSGRRYPKSFYDEGLGDILEWIDDEVLVHCDKKALGRGTSNTYNHESSDDNDSQLETRKNSKVRKKLETSIKDRLKNDRQGSKLYGDNSNPDKNAINTTKSLPLEINDNYELKVDKTLEDRTRGLINRLAAQTMPFVSSEFEKLYSTNLRNSVTQAIYNNLRSSIISEHAVTKRKLVAELMLLASYLNIKVSQEIGAYLIHMLVKEFETLYKQDDLSETDKRLDNITICIINSYVIGLISSNVIFEFARRICLQDFKIKSIELILLLIRNVGFQLRKESPKLMGQLIIEALEKVQNLKLSSSISSRFAYMNESLAAVKNNNVSKIRNYGSDIDRDTIESCLKSLIKRTRLPESLADASYCEILNSSNWHLLESRLDEVENPDTENRTQSVPAKVSSNDIKMCKALGLNKPTERTIFGALLRATDHMEATNLMIGFGLSHCSDVMVVCLHLAIHEKKYNQFHHLVINSLCKFNRRYKIAAKFSIQDKIRNLGRMPIKRVEIFKKLSFELIKSDAIPITILKSIEWSDLSQATRNYLTFLFNEISELPDDKRRHIMSKVEKKSSFAGAMRTFTKCFLDNCSLFQR